jgi:hypothetical protein
VEYLHNRSTQGEGKEGLVVASASSGCHYGYVLFAVFALIRDGYGCRAVVEFLGPEFLSCFGIEGPEAVVAGGAYEDEASGGGYRASEGACSSGILFTWWKRLGYA